MTVSEELKKKAIGLGLCVPWQEGWGTPTKEELVAKYIKGLDFCIEHDYPSVQYMKLHFDGIMQKQGVFADDMVDEYISTPHRKIVVINGSSCGNIKCSGYSVVAVYVRHTSKVEIIAEEHANTTVLVYDSANVVVKNRGIGRVSVIQHGGRVKTDGEVTIKDRR